MERYVGCEEQADEMMSGLIVVIAESAHGAFEVCTSSTSEFSRRAAVNLDEGLAWRCF